MPGIITMSLDSLVNLTLGQLVGAELYATATPPNKRSLGIGISL